MATNHICAWCGAELHPTPQTGCGSCIGPRDTGTLEGELAIGHWAHQQDQDEEWIENQANEFYNMLNAFSALE